MPADKSKFDVYLDSLAHVDLDDVTSIYQFLRSLNIQAAVTKDALAVIAPTWLINDKETLEDYLPDFESIEQRAVSLRDFACVPVFTISPFFKNPAAIFSRAMEDRVCPIEDDLSVSDRKGAKVVPIPGAAYYFAADFSVNTDSLGLAMVCKSPLLADAYELFFSKQVKVTKDVEADYESIELLIKNLRERGFKINGVGFDQFQSHRTKQILENQGFNVHITTYRQSAACDRTLKELMVTGRFLYGLCDNVFIGEATELQVINGSKIDHLSSGGAFNSKDVWDAVVGALFLCLEAPDIFIPEYE